jgi:hypothetical protein
MERIFELTVDIGGHRKDYEKQIIAACMVEWGFKKDEFEHVPANCGRKKLLQASGLGAISDNEQIDEIVARIERAVWRANGGEMCHVEVRRMFIKKIGSGISEPAMDEPEMELERLAS